jgi:polar amino acid transport system permease protein
MLETFDLLPPLLGGAVVTIELTALAGGLALLLAIPLALLRCSSHAAARWSARAYVETFRGTSALVQVYFFYFVLPLFGVSWPAFQTGVLALGLNWAAWASEVLRGSIQSVDVGQREAAAALSLPPGVAMRKVILPQAFLAALPPLGNMSIELLKSTSLVSLITITDLAFAAKLLLQETGRREEIYVLTLLIYFAIGYALSHAFQLLERRMSRGQLRGRTS